MPALFQPWAAQTAGIARLAPGQRALDVACGTGALTCTAAERVCRTGAVTGLDLNDEMLAELLQRPFGATVADAFRAPFAHPAAWT